MRTYASRVTQIFYLIFFKVSNKVSYAYRIFDVFLSLSFRVGDGLPKGDFETSLETDLFWSNLETDLLFFFTGDFWGDGFYFGDFSVFIG